jgi:hypothetical protein
MAIRAGVPKSAIVSRNVTMPPAQIAGSTRGTVIRRAVRNRRAPSMLAASSSSEDTSSSAPVVKTKR